MDIVKGESEQPGSVSCEREMRGLLSRKRLGGAISPSAHLSFDLHPELLLRDVWHEKGRVKP